MVKWFRNFVVFILKEGFQHGVGVELRTQDFDFGVLFWVSSSSLAQRALSGIELMEEIKLVYSLHHYNLKLFLKYRTSWLHTT